MTESLLALSSELVSNLFWFVAWSGLLFVISKAIDTRFADKLQWSSFWLLLCLLALFPLLPAVSLLSQPQIPKVLLTAVEQGNLIWHNSQQLLTTEIQMPASAWQYFCCYLLLHLALVICLKLNRQRKIIRQLKQLERLAINPEQLNCFSLQQLAFIRQNNIRVCQGNTSHSAFVFGWSQPILFLPTYLSSLPQVQQQLLIEHELTHIRRGDHKLLLVLRLYRCLFWFNPFLHYFEQRFVQSMELNCDKQVLSQNPQQLKQYANALVNSLKLSKAQSQLTDTGLTAAFTQHSANGQVWSQRLDNILTQHNLKKDKYMKVILSSACLLSALLVMGVQATQAQHTPDVLTHKAFSMPVEGARISAKFGATGRIWGKNTHKGIDFAVAKGTAVMANMTGTVIIADDTSLHKNYGKVVLLQHADNSQSLYAHLDSLGVSAGQQVLAGQQIGKVGTTGRSSGPHLHFELLVDGKRVDPSHRLPN